MMHLLSKHPTAMKTNKMQRFAHTIDRMDQSQDSVYKEQYLLSYFRNADSEEAMEAICLLCNKRPARLISSRTLIDWVFEEVDLPEWLFEQTMQTVGDPSEAAAILISGPSENIPITLSEVVSEMYSLRGGPIEEIRTTIKMRWQSLTLPERVIYNKLVTGTFRVSGISMSVLARVLSKCTGREEGSLIFQLTQKWKRGTISFRQLILDVSEAATLAQPYDFASIQEMESGEQILDIGNNQIAELRIPGWRIQLIRRAGVMHLWTENGLLLSEDFQGRSLLTESLAHDCVMEGTLNLTTPALDLPTSSMLKEKQFAQLIKKGGRFQFTASDLLEFNGVDIRTQPLRSRRSQLVGLIKKSSVPFLKMMDQHVIESVAALEQLHESCRHRNRDGLVLKQLDQPYPTKGIKSTWYFWKSKPLQIKAVLLYVAKGNRPSARYFAECTFAVWNDNELVPVGKTTEGLTKQMIIDIDKFVKDHTVERFGPVRSVDPIWVFELEFDQIQRSNRHKSGWVLEGLKVKRRHEQAVADQADTLEKLSLFYSLNE